MNTENDACAWWSNDNDEIFRGLKIGYYSATMTLLKKAIETDSLKEKDTLLFPIMFLYSHFLEISLKDITCKVGGNEYKHTHSLHELWQNLEKLLKENGFFDYHSNVSEYMNLIIKDFNKYNNGSMDFRFLKDKKENLIFKKPYKLNYHSLKEEIKKSYITLGGLEEALNDYLYSL